MTLVTRLFILLLSTSLVGCSYLTSPFKNRDREYLNARSIPPLQIPPGISSNTFHNSYPVSSKQYPRSVEDVSLEPPGLMDK